MKLLKINLIVKTIRAKIIKNHLAVQGKNHCVCFTCGNAAAALRKEGLSVTAVGYHDELIPAKWFNYSEIQIKFNGLFDATSGHLPFPLMVEIAKQLKLILGELDDTLVYNVPTGSGESIVCLAIAYPSCNFIPIRTKGKETKYEVDAPLNGLVFALFGTVGL